MDGRQSRSLARLLQRVRNGLLGGPKVKSVDWDELAALGAPLLQHQSCGIRPSPEKLATALKRAATGKPRNREKEALQAVLLALKLHFPTFYAECCGTSPRLKSLTPGVVSGRLVKLSRVAREALAAYL